MGITLFNTLGRKKETFVPIDGKTARIYSCGPTVYMTAHIGNLRAYICCDVLKKVIKLFGYDVLDVMNITDVGHLVTDGDDGEDKVEKEARRLKMTPEQIARHYTEEFMRDIASLNIDMPGVVCPATDHVSEMIDFIKKLEAKGFTYTTSDGVYFDASQYANYTKLNLFHFPYHHKNIQLYRYTTV